MTTGPSDNREATGATAADRATGVDRVVEHRHTNPVTATSTSAEERRKDAYGGLNLGAAFFGWLVAVAMTILLAGVLSTIAAGIGSNDRVQISSQDLRADATTISVVTGVVLLVVLMIGYYAGGYVAGRMSRFDGAKQGMGVWAIGLLVTIIAAIIASIAGAQYNVLQYVPTIPIPAGTLTRSGLIALAVVLVGTLLAAIAGGVVGHRYHDKVDRVR